MGGCFTYRYVNNRKTVVMLSKKSSAQIVPVSVLNWCTRTVYVNIYYIHVYTNIFNAFVRNWGQLELKLKNEYNGYEFHDVNNTFHRFSVSFLLSLCIQKWKWGCLIYLNVVWNFKIPVKHHSKWVINA